MLPRALPLVLLFALAAPARGAELLISVPQDEQTDEPANAREFSVRPGEKLSLVAELYDRDGASLVGRNKSYERPYPFRWRAECDGGCSVTLESAPPVVTVLVPDRMTGPITIEVSYAGPADAEAVPPARITLVDSENKAHARAHAADEDEPGGAAWFPSPSSSAPSPAPSRKSSAKKKPFVGSSGGGGGGGSGGGSPRSQRRSDEGGGNGGSSFHESEWGTGWGGGGASPTTARGYNRDNETPVLACKRPPGKLGPLHCEEARPHRRFPPLRLVKKPLAKTKPHTGARKAKGPPAKR